jgi:peptide/nickel transport system ATP-binding protein
VLLSVAKEAVTLVTADVLTESAQTSAAVAAEVNGEQAPAGEAPQAGTSKASTASEDSTEESAEPSADDSK